MAKQRDKRSRKRESPITACEVEQMDQEEEEKLRLRRLSEEINKAKLKKRWCLIAIAFFGVLSWLAYRAGVEIAEYSDCNQGSGLPGLLIGFL